MDTCRAEHSQTYIEKHYLTRAEISKQSGVAEPRIAELVEAQCIPPHSYEVRRDTTYVSAFGEYKFAAESEFYYHPDIVHWIERAVALAKNHPLQEVSQKVRENLVDEIRAILDGRPVPWSDGMGHAWEFLMDGSFSLCLKELNADNLVKKEVSRQRLAELVEKADGRGKTEDLWNEMEGVIADYEDVTLPFSPHELPESSRRLELEPAMAKFGIHKLVEAAE